MDVEDVDVVVKVSKFGRARVFVLGAVRDLLYVVEDVDFVKLCEWIV